MIIIENHDYISVTNSNDLSSYYSHNNSVVTHTMAQYSVFAEERDTKGCFFLFPRDQCIPKKNAESCGLFLGHMAASQSTSASADNFREELAWRRKPGGLKQKDEE